MKKPSVSVSISCYLKKGAYPFHMPGHKRNAAFLPRDLLSLDMTEIPGMDNLRQPSVMLRGAQEYAAMLYGADESFFLVNGASAGLIAAICSVCKEGERLAVARNSHVSVYNALVFSGAAPVYFMPGYARSGLCGGVGPEDIPGGVKAAILVSPTYEGFVSDIAAIAEKVHRQNGILIVDEAHGAHFPFHHSFPVHAMKLGADIVVTSLHKTLPAPSQCALLHINGPRVDRDKLRFYLNAIQTTSPSYMLMAAMDHTLRHLNEQPAHFESYVERLASFRAALPDATDTPVRLTGREFIGAAGIYDTDAGKLLFDVCAAKSAVEIAALMVSMYRVQMEMAGPRYMLGLTSPADTDNGFSCLREAINALNQTCVFVRRADIPPPPFPEIALAPRDALRQEAAAVDWHQAAGEIAGDFLVPYPPGIPLLAPGERITEAVIQAAAAYGLPSGPFKIINRKGDDSHDA
jgi:lysine decarboxylase